ncbi:MAG: hypothetical protein ACI89U_002766 [Gammaproteobacteria bacterium]|jgi:hypothetical protein
MFYNLFIDVRELLSWAPVTGYTSVTRSCHGKFCVIMMCKIRSVLVYLSSYFDIDCRYIFCGSHTAGNVRKMLALMLKIKSNGN